MHFHASYLYVHTHTHMQIHTHRRRHIFIHPINIYRHFLIHTYIHRAWTTHYDGLSVANGRIKNLSSRAEYMTATPAVRRLLSITSVCCVCVCVSMYVCMYVCVYVLYASCYCSFICLFICLHLSVCMYVCTYVCMYIRHWVSLLMKTRASDQWLKFPQLLTLVLLKNTLALRG